MAQVGFEVRGDGMAHRFTLIGLDEYEGAGGDYDDGEEIEGPGSRDEFVCAISDDVLIYDDAGEQNEVLDHLDHLIRTLGLDNGDFWLDNSNGWMLLRKFPKAAPEAARLAVAGRLV